MNVGDKIYYLLSFPLGGFASWLFDNTRLFPPQILLGLILGRKPRKVGPST